MSKFDIYEFSGRRAYRNRLLGGVAYAPILWGMMTKTVPMWVRGLGETIGWFYHEGSRVLEIVPVIRERKRPKFVPQNVGLFDVYSEAPPSPV